MDRRTREARRRHSETRSVRKAVGDRTPSVERSCGSTARGLCPGPGKDPGVRSGGPRRQSVRIQTERIEATEGISRTGTSECPERMGQGTPQTDFRNRAARSAAPEDLDQQEGISSEVVDQLRKQYEERLQDAIQQKTQLAQELQSASRLLEAERARLSSEIGKSESKAAAAPGHTFDKEALSAEVARVEAQIQQIVTLIDDPETELS